MKFFSRNVTQEENQIERAAITQSSCNPPLIIIAIVFLPSSIMS